MRPRRAPALDWAIGSLKRGCINTEMQKEDAVIWIFMAVNSDPGVGESLRGLPARQTLAGTFRHCGLGA
jgi:hypothetical protein